MVQVAGSPNSGPANPSTPESGPNSSSKMAPRVVIDDGAQPVGCGGVEEGHEVGFVDVDRQVGALEVADRRARDVLPLTEGVADESVGLRLSSARRGRPGRRFHTMFWPPLGQRNGTPSSQFASGPPAWAGAMTKSGAVNTTSAIRWKVFIAFLLPAQRRSCARAPRGRHTGAGPLLRLQPGRRYSSGWPSADSGSTYRSRSRPCARPTGLESAMLLSAVRKSR